VGASVVGACVVGSSVVGASDVGAAVVGPVGVAVVGASVGTGVVVSNGVVVRTGVVVGSGVGGTVGTDVDAPMIFTSAQFQNSSPKYPALLTPQHVFEHVAHVDFDS